MPLNNAFINSDLIRSKFFSLKTRDDVANIIEVSEQGLRHLLYKIPDSSKYRVFSIPKKNGEKRLIASPNPQLKGLQTKLLKVLETIYKPKICSHGFILSRSICSNAKRHIGCRFVLNIDIADFFTTIHFGRVYGMFMARPYYLPKEVAIVLAQIACFDKSLPQGSPISPIISNMLCAKLDSQLMKLAGKLRCNYSRYADDLTFSTNQKEFPKVLASIDESNQTIVGEELEEILKRNGFNINPKKSRLQIKSERQEVTGLVVNKKLNVNRRYIRSIRALLNNWEKYGLLKCEKDYQERYIQKNPHKAINEKISFEQMVKGKISFLGMVRGLDDTIYIKFINKLAKLSPNLINSQTKAYLERMNNKADWLLSNLVVVEAKGLGDEWNEGTGFFLENNGLITCAHIFGRESEMPVNNAWKITVSNRDESVKAKAIIKKIDYDLDLAVLETDYEPAYYFSADDKQEFVIDKTEVKLAGFPNHSPTNSGRVSSGKIISKKRFLGNEFYVINVNIISGNSGGPVFNSDDKVIGIAARGASNDADGYNTEFHGFIPIVNLKELKDLKI